MSSHPGSTMSCALDLACQLKKEGYSPEQVQDYYPTPGTVSTVMFYTHIDPLTGKKVFVADDYEEKRMQRALLQYSRPQNADLVRKAIRLCGREDLIGYGPECLVRPAEGSAPSKREGNSRPRSKAEERTKNASKGEARGQRGRSGNNKPSQQRSKNGKNNTARGKKRGK